MNAVNFTPWMQVSFWIAIAMVIVMAILGNGQWQVGIFGFFKRFNNNLLKTVSTACGFVLACIYTVENAAGVTSWHEAGAAAGNADQALTVGFGLVLTWLTVLVVSIVVLYGIGRLFANARCGKLYISRIEDPEIQAKIARKYRQRRNHWDQNNRRYPPMIS